VREKYWFPNFAKVEAGWLRRKYEDIITQKMYNEAEKLEEAGKREQALRLYRNVVEGEMKPSPQIQQKAEEAIRRLGKFGNLGMPEAFREPKTAAKP
jgi:hypothetical protein